VVSINKAINHKSKKKKTTVDHSIELTTPTGRGRSSTAPSSSSSPSNGEVDDGRNTVGIHKKNKKKTKKKTKKAKVVSRIQQQNNERKKKLVVIPWIQHQQQTYLTTSTASESQQSPTDTVVTPMYTGFPTSSSVQTDITTDTGIIQPNDNDNTIATPATYTNTSSHCYTNTTSSSAYMTNKEEWDNNDEIYDMNNRYQQLLNNNTVKVKDDPSVKYCPFDEESGVPGGDNSSSSNSSGYDVFAGIFDKQKSKKKEDEEHQECGGGYQELEDDSVFDGCDSK